MSQQHQDDIKQKFDPQMTTEHLDTIIQELHSADVLSTLEVECVNSKTDPVAKWASFIEIIKRRPDRIYQQLILALDQCKKVSEEGAYILL